MVYFDIEKFKKIKSIKDGRTLAITRAAIILLLAGAVAAIILLQRQETGDERQETRLRQGYGGQARDRGQTISEEQKKKVLEGLSAPADSPQYTGEEKRKILESLSAPSGQLILSEEEKKKILESLSAPQE